MDELLRMLDATGGDEDLERRKTLYGTLYPTAQDKATSAKGRDLIKRKQMEIRRFNMKQFHAFLLEQGPMSPVQLARMMGYAEITTTRKRINELVKLGAVRCVRPPNRNQSLPAIWEAVPYEFD